MLAAATMPHGCVMCLVLGEALSLRWAMALAIDLGFRSLCMESGDRLLAVF